MKVMDEMIVRSALGEYPENISYDWSPLEEMSEADIADIGLKSAQTARELARTQLIDPSELSDALRSQLIENKVFPNLGEQAATESEIFEVEEAGEDPFGIEL